MQSPQSEAELGREAARALWQFGLEAADINDPLTPQFARAALAELERLQEGTPGVLREALAGAQMSAEQLSVEPFHGLVEIVQNADDLGATEIRVAVRTARDQSRLLVAHNGERVQLRHVVAMTLAFVSTKRDDARAKGRFGIGLKSLGRLGDSLAVHSPPYHFAIAGNHVARTSPRRTLSGFYEATNGDTLLELRLHHDFDFDQFAVWFRQIRADAMVFLDSVRSLRLVRLGRSRAISHHRLTERKSPTIKLPGVTVPCHRTTLREPQSGRTWVRYEIEVPVPRRLRRRHKATGKATPLAIAVPGEPTNGGGIYAGLPLGVSSQMRLSLNAQFDVDVARRGIQHVILNEWLLKQLAHLAAGVALDRLRRSATKAWHAIPLLSELSPGDDTWLAQRLAEFVSVVQRRVKRGFLLKIGDEEHGLSSFVYETESLEGLIGQREVDGLKSGLLLLPRRNRDRAGRWRAVLKELGGVTEIDVREALQLLDWEEAQLARKDSHWFIKLARAAIEAELGDHLRSQRSILTADETRIVPPVPESGGTLLVRSVPPKSLASRLGIADAIHGSYLSRSPHAVAVRAWLEEHGMLLEAPSSESTLRALSSRNADEAPISIDDEGLRLLRDAFTQVDPHVRRDLGHRVGRVVTVDTFVWTGDRRKVRPGRPASAYLPATIDDRRDGWSKAAGRTRGIEWVHPRYDDVLRRPGRLAAGSDRSAVLGSKAFFSLLGAEVAPRLVAPGQMETRYGVPASPIDRANLAPSQREALAALERHATHLQRDRLSPDLEAVLHNLQRERGRRRRRERARALLTTLEREWSRLYADHTTATAVWSDWTWHAAGDIPSSWIARAMDQPWLTSEDGQRKAPRELVIRTPVSEAIYGDDRSAFAYEVDASDARSPVVVALGIEADPPVSELVDQLTALRQRGQPVDEEAIALRYAAISAAFADTEPTPDDMIGDLTLRQLRARFGTRRNKPGLVYINPRWLSPSDVFLGPPIFGQHRAFVSNARATRNLWRGLRVTYPSVSDCLDFLEELARHNLDRNDEHALVNTYLYLEANLESATRRERSRLANLPLWTGSAWRTERPVFVVADGGVARALAEHVPVWLLPVGIRTIPNLMDVAKATRVADSEFTPVIRDGAFATGASIEPRYVAAVELLRDWLTRHDRALYEALTLPWDQLANARLAIDHELRLEISLYDTESLTVHTSAYLTHEPLTLYFPDTQAVGEDDAGGRVMASLFGPGDQDKLALAWSNAFAKARRGQTASVSLAEDEEPSDEALEALFEQAKESTAISRRRSNKRVSPSKPRQQPATEPAPVRRLKRAEDLTPDEVLLTKSGPAGKRRPQRRGLRGDLPDAEGITASKRVPTSAPLAYSPADREQLALEVLRVAVDSGRDELRDYRHLRGIGADAVDKLRRYFEIKSFYGNLPDQVTLTANEAERALSEGSNFLLAVVAGLEEGYETIVKIIPDPVRLLQLKDTTSVHLIGVTRQPSAIEIRFTPAGESGTAAQGETTP